MDMEPRNKKLDCPGADGLCDFYLVDFDWKRVVHLRSRTRKSALKDFRRVHKSKRVNTLTASWFDWMKRYEAQAEVMGDFDTARIYAMPVEEYEEVVR